jgi:DMSO/TMAO reductase YedYZ molybdopterin-dependent catalytic subunit
MGRLTRYLPRTRTLAYAATGLLAAIGGIASAHLVAGLTNPATSPVLAVSSVVIDLTPTPVKEYAVAPYGTADKPILLGLHRVVKRGEATTIGDGCHELPPTAYPTSHDGRRQFLIGAVAVTVGAACAAAFGQKLASAELVPQTTLPTPADPAGAFPKGVEGKVRGITPLQTSNAAFYRVDTNLTVPRVSADRWKLEIDGMVDRPMTITHPQLLAMPMIERDITLTCVSNEVGGGYVGAARWQGVSLADLLDRVGVRPGADQLLSTAVEGFRIGSPMEVVRDGRDAMIAVGMNGRPLPAIHGFPARTVTPGLYGFVSATKWLARLTATTYAKDVAYWTERDWATDAPIKMSSRVDTPRPLSTIRAGMTAIGGVAWAQPTGIADVEVSIDDGPWQRTKLGTDVGLDYWRQWYLPWKATPGRHALKVRATDSKGAVQLARRAKPFPSGSSGIQEVVVFVE